MTLNVLSAWKGNTIAPICFVRRPLVYDCFHSRAWECYLLLQRARFSSRRARFSFLPPVMSLISLWFMSSSLVIHSQCVCDPVSYIFCFPIRLLHTLRFLWTPLTSAFMHGLHASLPPQLSPLLRSHFLKPKTLKTPRSCRTSFNPPNPPTPSGEHV